LFEEAEHGFRRSIELGNYEMDTWISRCDILLQLGEYDAAINNLLQSKEFYPENAEIEYRLAGLYYTVLEPNKGVFHLKNALDLDEEFAMIIEELFPSVYKNKSVKQLIVNHQKPSV
jgi:tetratricopeptide (TPR) repeat protein